MSEPAPSLPDELNPRGRARNGSRRRNGRRWRRILTRALAALAALVVLASAGAYALYRHYNGQITRVAIRAAGPAAGAAAGSTPAGGSDGSENVLLMGSDSRDFAGGQSYNVAPGSPAYVTGQRSDVVILLHIPAGAAKATLVSFPRDSWVTIPTYTDTKGVAHKAVQAKLNAAFALGGAPLLVSTIENLTGVHIDHFAAVNFPGFQSMVDAVGGLDVCIGTTRHDKNSGDYDKNSGDFLTAGTHHVNGTQALALVRDRESFSNQDLGRIKDQEYFLATMMHKVLSAGTLSDPFKLNAFLNAATKSLTVDDGLSLSDMRRLASRFAHLSSANLTFATVPVANANYSVTSSIYGGQMQSAVELDAARSAALFATLAGTPVSSAPPPTMSTSVPLDTLSVRVRNATATTGLAHRAADDLTALGVHVVGVGNAPTGTSPDTVVLYPAGQLAAAQALQAHVPGAQLQEQPAVSGLTLDLGANYTGVRANPTSGGSSVAPPAQAPASPTVVSASSLACAP